MIAAELIADLARRGIRLEACGDRLRYSPRSALTPDLIDRLTTHKAGVLALLMGGGQQSCLDKAAVALASSPTTSVPHRDSPARRVIGNGHPPVHLTIPPDSILASPRVPCLTCYHRPVLPELRAMTGGMCWDCWLAANSPAARSDVHLAMVDPMVIDRPWPTERS